MSFSSSTILTFLLVFLVSNIIIVRSSKSNNLIEQACSTSLLSSKSKQCVQILGSQPKIVSANNFYDMSIEIMGSGIPSATNTSTYIEKLLRTAGPIPKDALQGCKAAHDWIVTTFEMTLREVKGKEYDGANYDLLIGSTDGFKHCLADVAAWKIKDRTILRGNDMALIYGLSAYQAVCDIPIKSSSGSQ